MKTLEVLLLADDKPGHYHLAQGVIAALERLVNINTTRINVRQRRWAPGRILSALVNNKVSEKTILNFGYGINLKDLARADLVISAGGNTLAANIAAARTCNAENIFIGSLRHFYPHDFSVVITSYERFAHLPRHLVSLKPCPLDPDALDRPENSPLYGADNPPAIAGLLLGGNTTGYKFKPNEWQKLIALLDDTHQSWGTKWLVSNSRRTPDFASDLFAQKATQSDNWLEFIDYRYAGPGTVQRIYANADVILCTQDSSSMISEAIAAQRHVIGLTPEVHDFTPQEKEYRQYLQQNNWTRTLAIASLSPEIIEKTLDQICPMKQNHLNLLAEKLAQRLPELLL
jgi:uncharacterized protein